MPDNLTVASKSEAKRPKKVRNYSFQNSKRLPPEKMTEVNGVRIPSMPGSCYHAIICALAHNKDQFCPWDKIYEMTEKYMRQYGGNKSWDKFVSKSKVKPYQQRIKDNAHTLTRTGKDCYGYRLHELGMSIYFFKDGAMLKTNGTMVTKGNSYDVSFPDGSKMQVRYRGTAMSSKEFKRFLDAGYIDISGTIKDHDGIRKMRTGRFQKEEIPTAAKPDNIVHVCITLSEEASQDTADRLMSLGLVVEETIDEEIFGTVPSPSIKGLKEDPDVIHLEMIDE